MNWKPLKLQSKEGLALLNGTQFMSAHGVYALMEAYKLSYMADLIGSISLDAFDCNYSPFDELVHLVRVLHQREHAVVFFDEHIVENPLDQQHQGPGQCRLDIHKLVRRRVLT